MIHGEFKVIQPTYLLTRKCGDVSYISATRVDVDTERGVVLFYNGKSVDAMFRLEDVKTYVRIV